MLPHGGPRTKASKERGDIAKRRGVGGLHNSWGGGSRYALSRYLGSGLGGAVLSRASGKGR